MVSFSILSNFIVVVVVAFLLKLSYFLKAGISPLSDVYSQITRLPNGHLVYTIHSIAEKLEW